ncbi:LacI family DNA-binding transcriptional regulator [Cellulomonas endophytica]|uniref:LacI family DNA-binding transcriptional regulator n=1 Tax=Cellulomonas endophytica TaxID=2494735 RepID=UPI0010108E0C|nr:LacI family DNA-binding transcriptional regulator [Cellulomonas endophytica]
MARTTITDVAREAGVSATTVSLVLNGRNAERFPEATRRRVHDAAAALGYAPNVLARGLRTQRTHTVGLISDRITTTPYAVAMVEAAQDVAREHGRLLFLVGTDGDPAVEADAVRALLAQQVDGIVYAAMWHRPVAPAAPLPAGTVYLDCFPEAGGGPAVVPDDRAGAVAAIRLLVAAGHRRIAYVDIGEDPAPLASGLRHTGYLDVLREAGVTPDPALHVRSATATAADAADAVDGLLALPADRRPTALFCFNDRIAAGAYASARHHGLVIPEDLSVVGYDDQQLIATELDPPLTTVALPHYAMGRWATEVLLGVTPPPDAADGVLRMPCPLVERGSVSPPRAP